jgi:hypothetical protein
MVDMYLEFRTQVGVEDRNLGVISSYVVFKAMRWDMLSQRMGRKKRCGD